MDNNNPYKQPCVLKVRGLCCWVIDVTLSSKQNFNLGSVPNLTELLEAGITDIMLIPRIDVEGPNWSGYYYPTLNQVVAKDGSTGYVTLLSKNVDYVFVDHETGRRISSITASNKVIQLTDLTPKQPFTWHGIKAMSTRLTD